MKRADMEFIDLEAQYAALGPGIEARMRRVLAHGKYIMGPEVAELEERLASYCKVSHAITCANGTDALCLALRALDIGPGDAVFTTPFTFFATAEAIALVGARPLFVDIDPSTFNLDPSALVRAISDTARDGKYRARAVIAVDLFGLTADYAKLEPLCAAAGLDLIEDAAQAFGATNGSRVAGSFGRVATTSFFPAKPLGCYGDGGALFTNDARLAAKLRSLRVHGQGTDKYDNVLVGMNSRLDTLQAAILLEKLATFPAELEARERVARRYGEHLAGQLVTPEVPAWLTSSWAQYSVLARDDAHRSAILRGLDEKHVPTAIYYAKALHQQPALASLGYARGDFPVSEQISDRVFSLPMHPYLTVGQQDQVLEALGDVFARSGG
jgi:dTDP-4-amino-4,6-dideoxygalactose transaminase